MILKDCKKLKAMLTLKAWDLACADYGFAEISDTSETALEKIAAELELDAALFLGAETFESSSHWTRHDFDNEVIDEVRFYKGEELVNVANKLYDNYYLEKLANEKLKWSILIGKRVTREKCDYIL